MPNATQSKLINNTNQDATIFDQEYMLNTIPEEVILDRASQILEKSLKDAPCFTAPDDVKLFCQTKLAHELDEHFCCLFLTSQHHLLKFERIFRGTVDGASVHPRVIVRRCLELNAAAVIFTHNHPSGITSPSNADKTITARLQSSLDLIDVRVLDHLIVGGNTTTSFAELGLI